MRVRAHACDQNARVVLTRSLLHSAGEEVVLYHIIQLAQQRHADGQYDLTRFGNPASVGMYMRVRVSVCMALFLESAQPHQDRAVTNRFYLLLLQTKSSSGSGSSRSRTRMFCCCTSTPD